MSETITVILEEIKCISDTKEKKHDDIYLHLYSYHDGKEIDLGPEYWSNPLKMNDKGDNNAYINKSLNVSKSFVDKIKISMRDKDTSSDNLSAETPSNWDLIADQEIKHDSALQGTLTFKQSGNKTGEYRLSYQIIDKPIPTLRVLAIYCEQDSAGDCATAIDKIYSMRADCAKKAAKIIGKSPRPRAKAISAGLRAASWVYKGIALCSEWISNALEGDDDVYMQRTAGGDSVDGGPFFPPEAANYKMHKVTKKGTEANEIVIPPDGEITEEYIFNKHNTVFFQETYGEYFRIPLDKLAQEAVTIQLKDEDHRSDDAIGALTITQEKYELFKDEGAQIEVAAVDYGGNDNKGAVYHICYSVGLENWAMPANTDLQETTGLPVAGACYNVRHFSYESYFCHPLPGNSNTEHPALYPLGYGDDGDELYDLTVEYLTEDIVRLIFLKDNLAMYADGFNEGDEIKLAPPSGSGSQRWRIKDMEDGSVCLTNVDSNKLLYSIDSGYHPFFSQYSASNLTNPECVRFRFFLADKSNS